MTLPLFLFWVFSVIIILSSLMVVSTRKMVHAAVFLVLAFFNAAGLFILAGAEYLAMLLIIVYVGAIAVLFLFVVMMLDVDKFIKKEIDRNKPLLLMVAVILFSEILITLQISGPAFASKKSDLAIPADVDNVRAIGMVLYTDFAIPFQLAGAILLVAMIGAIVLTLKEDNRFIRKQEISDQNSRNKENSIVLTKPEIGKGLDL